MQNEDDLRKLARKLCQRWCDLRIWSPEVIARQRNFCLFLDREGHLAFVDDCGPGGIRGDSRGNPAWYAGKQQFDEAVERTGCTAGHFERAMKRLQRSRPLTAFCYLLLTAKLRRGWRRLKCYLTPMSAGA